MVFQQLTYDGNGRVLTETDAVGNTATFQYDSRGLLTEYTNGRGQTIQYQYDSDQQLVQESRPDRTISYAYNAAGEPIKISDDNGAIYMSYDDLGRLLWRSEDPSAGYISKYGYDAAGNRVSVTYPQASDSEATPKVVQYVYDAAGQLTTVTDWNNRKTSYTYDRSGSLAETSLPDGSQVSRTYDAASRLTGLQDTAPSRIIAKYTYTLDVVGQRTGVDATEPLLPNPVLPGASFSYGAANQQVAVDGVSQVFDEDGNLSEGFLKGEGTTFQYDAQNRLTAFGSVQHRYDVEGHRIATIRDGQEARYLVDPNADLSRVLEERKESGDVVRYVYGHGLISREDGDGGNYRVYHYDSRGSTVALTDETGSLTDAYSYAPFGQLTQVVGSTPNPFRYNGRDGVMSGDDGLYYMRARFYQPEALRFLGRDSLLGDVLVGQSLNRYAFVEGDPVGFVDPRGLSKDGGSSGSAAFDVNVSNNACYNSEGLWVCADGETAEIASFIAATSTVLAAWYGGRYIVGPLSIKIIFNRFKGELFDKSYWKNMLKARKDRKRGDQNKWPEHPKGMDEILNIPGRNVPDGDGTPGRGKIIWNPSKDIEIIYEKHPYHTEAPSYHKDSHWHFDMPGYDHVRYLPGQPMP